MKYLSVCSGIEAATVAWHPLGWTPLAFSEIEPFPSAVLAHHWPDVPNLGDMTKHHDWPNTFRPDLIVGGTPCQAFSVAGLRKGLADPRGNLTLTFLAILAQYRPAWVVWENVPGVLSDKTGAFGSFLGGLAELGYGWAYRVLDAQHFGIPQRRRRVFVVGCLGGWGSAAAVLFERESLLGHPLPRRETREGIAAGIAGSLGSRGTRSHIELDGHGAYIPEVVGALDTECGGGEMTNQTAANGHLIPSWWDGSQTAQTLDAVLAKRQTMPEKNRFPAVLVPETAHSLRGEGFDASEDGTGRGTPLVPVAFARESGAGWWQEDQVAGTLDANMGCSGHASRPGIMNTPTMAVRRLTPTECERLQGFPDGHTLIPWRGKPAVQCPDGPRYKALGNSMAVPVMRWIGERIDFVSNLTTTATNPTTA